MKAKTKPVSKTKCNNEIVPRDFDFFRVRDGKLDGRFVFYSLVRNGNSHVYGFVVGEMLVN